MRQLLYDEVKDPSGNQFRVSTVRTLAGGSPDKPADVFSIISGARMSDFANYSAWPFETMVFRLPFSSFGLYHAPYASEADARLGHENVVKSITEGLEFGGGVNEDGEPSITPDQWAERISRQ